MVGQRWERMRWAEVGRRHTDGDFVENRSKRLTWVEGSAVDCKLDYYGC